MTKKSRRKVRQLASIVFCITLAGMALILAIARFTNYRPFTKHDPDFTETVRVGLPSRLHISKISVDAAIDYVGLTPTGDMDVPSGYDKGGWYKEGPRPGDSGSAVIDGHFGRADRGKAVFDNLHMLQKGDEISVTDAQGGTVVFRVTGARSYAPGEDATAVFRSTDGKPRLNLITCQGGWDNDQSSYASRLVIFSEKE